MSLWVRALISAAEGGWRTWESATVPARRLAPEFAIGSQMALRANAASAVPDTRSEILARLEVIGCPLGGIPARGDRL